MAENMWSLLVLSRLITLPPKNGAKNGWTPRGCLREDKGGIKDSTITHEHATLENYVNCVAVKTTITKPMLAGKCERPDAWLPLLCTMNVMFVIEATRNLPKPLWLELPPDGK